MVHVDCGIYSFFINSGISIGLPVGGTPEGCMYMLNHSKVQFIFAEDHQQVDKILQVR
jgi:long-subunit acyl-CoA synthetase (AMP-forming)